MRVGNWNAGRQNESHHVIFDASSRTRFSHVFTVTAPSSWVVQAYGLQEGQCVCLEMVSGCKDGEFFEPVKASCGCCMCLSHGRTIIPIPMEGRYRLVACSEDYVGNFRVVAHPTAIPQEFWSSYTMSCCTPAAPPAPPVTITSPKGTIAVGGAHPNFQVDIQPVATAGELATSGPAMTILCAALQAMNCFPETVSVAPGPNGTVIISTPTGVFPVVADICANLATAPNVGLLQCV